jgi:DNA-binding MarR family transcriptional regulator
MYYIHKYKEMKQIQLATMMNLKPSTVTRLLDRMENHELSKRYTNPDNKREIIITLTEKGNKTIETLLPHGDKFNNDLVKDIPSEELAIFQKVMDKMLENIMGTTPIK